MALRLLTEVHHALELGNLDKLLKKTLSEGAQPVFFLDYDGTLSPIVDNPDESYLPSQTRQTLVELAKRFHVSIVTGRSKEKIMQFLEIQGDEFERSKFVVASSHGQEITMPKSFDENAENFSVGQNIADQLQQVKSQLQSKLDLLPYSRNEIWIEDNKFALSFHYRLETKKSILELDDIIEEYIASYNTNMNINPHQTNLVKGEGKRLFEVRANTNFNKGNAVTWILNFLRKKNKGINLVPIVLGDDVTDEDAFKVVAPSGLPILVRGPEKLSKKETFAQFYLDDPNEVNSFLLKFL